ncbi:MAG TPA: peptidoglycan DD-metalloendopeptidase family protein [Gammaproteobacteria bacterium]
MPDPTAATVPGPLRRPGRRWLLPGLLLGLLLAGAPAAAEPDQGAREAELEQLRGRIRALQQELASTRGEHDQVRERLQATEQQIAALHRDLARTESALGAQERRLATLQGERQVRLEALAGQRTALAEQVRAAYAMGRQERLKIVLNQQDPALLGRMLGYYDYFNRARLARIDAIEDLLERLRAIEEELEVERERLAALYARHQASAAALEQERAARADLVATLAGEIADKDRQLERFRNDEARLAQLLASLQRALDDIPASAAERKPFASLRGRLEWPASGRHGARFGQRRGIAGTAWQGVLIEAAEGGAVRAVSHGRVAFADWLRGFGLLLILDHGDGYMSLYGHNQGLNKEVGDWVQTGEVIASVGRSGGRERPGLYFEIRHRGQPVNPARWCRAPARRGTG